MSEKQRNISSKTIDWLLSEIGQWEKEALISPDQKEKLVTRYRAQKESSYHDYTTLIISVIGALLIGMGIILFFAYNWDKIPRMFRLALILVTMSASYVGGMWGREKYPAYKGIGESFIFLGVILFGSGIWLIAQMYNIEIEYPWGWFFWAIAATAITYTADSIPVSLLSSVLWLAWAITCLCKWNEPNFLFLPLAACAIFPFVYCRKSLLALWGALLCLFFGTLFAMDNRVMFYALSAMGVTSIQAGIIHLNMDKEDAFTGPYLKAGFFSLLLGLYVGSFQNYQDTFWIITDHDWQSLFIIGIWAACGVISSILCWKAWDKKYHRMDLWYELIGRGLPILVLVYSTFLPVMIQFEAVDTNIALISAIFSNFLLLGIAASLLYLGQKENQLSLLYVGTIIFLLIAIGRYFDLFEDRLQRSVYFLVIGGLFIWYSFWLSKKHKEIKAMQREAE